jgi:hypothetical protein
MPQKIAKYLTSSPLIIIDIVLALLFAGLILNYFAKSSSVKSTNYDSAAEIAQMCANESDKQGCYKKELVALTKNLGFSNAEKTLYALQDIDEFTKSCHVLAHYMAREALNIDPDKFLELVDSINVSVCGSGFLHGVLEAKLSFDPTLKVDGNLADEICNRGTDEYRKRMCAHFMGHLFLVDTNGDVPQALPVCDTVIQQFKFDCYDGLFMEDHQKLALAEHQIVPEPQYTPQYLEALENNCQKYGDVAANACWTEIAEVAAKTYSYDPAKIYESCMKAKSPSSQNACYYKGGTVVVTYPIEPELPKLLSICKYYENNESQYQACTNNMISSLMYYSPKYTSRAIKICSQVASPQDWCFKQVGSYLAQFVKSKEERSVLCQTSPKEYKPLCESN